MIEKYDLYQHWSPSDRNNSSIPNEVSSDTN